MTQAALFDAVPAAPPAVSARGGAGPGAGPRYGATDAALLRSLLARCHRHDWMDTGLLLEHLAERGRVMLVAGLDGAPARDGAWPLWTVLWAPDAQTPPARVSGTSEHRAVRALAERLAGIAGDGRSAA